MIVAIAAAGTGGHVLPALSVALSLEALGVAREDLLFLGGDRFEARAVPAAGYRFAGFPLTRLQRRFTVENLRIPFVVRSTTAAIAEELRRSKVEVVLGMVGYATVPASLAAARVGIPFLVHEQNADPGLSARFAARRAHSTLLGLPGRSQRLPRSEVVGNPLRREFEAFDRTALRGAARRRYGLPAEGRVIGIVGGSQGAQALNQVATDLVGVAGCPVLHLTGPAGHGVGHTNDPSLPWVKVPFEDRMQDFYAAVDLVVCRAGAMTVSELAATSTPSILVPLERVGQTANARVLTEAGAALMVEQHEIGSLAATASTLIGDAAALSVMAGAAARLARPDAAHVVATRVLEAVHG